MRRLILSMLGVCLLALMVGMAQADTIYNFSNFMSATPTDPPNTNPYTDAQGGVWGYGYYSTTNPGPSNFTPFNSFATSTSTAPGLFLGWSQSSKQWLGYIGIQTGAAAQANGYYYNLNEPTMQIAYQPAGITWTAPAAGSITLNVTYEAVGLSSSNYTSSKPQSEIFQVSGGNTTVVDPLTSMAAYQATHNYTTSIPLTVAAGDTFEFAGIGVIPSSNQTPAVSISGTIDFAPVPEPSSAVLLVCGLAGLLTYAWKKRR